MFNIVLIGTGQIGSRHLQALSNLNMKTKIELVDISEESMNVAIGRFNQMPNSSIFEGEIVKCNKIEAVSDEIDVAIVTTAAKGRREIVEELLNKKTVKALILEKVLFQDLDDYPVVANLIKEKQVETYVNFPRRLFPTYQKLRKEIINSSLVEMNVYGSGWGLACNGLHLIDLFCFLTGSEMVLLNFEHLDPTIISSKRSGYKEITGQIHGENNKGSFTITCHSDVEPITPMSIDIRTSKGKYIIRESGQNKGVLYATTETNWAWKEMPFELRYQSQLTDLVVNDIIASKDVGLTNYHEAIQPHEGFIKGVLEHINKNSNKKYKICPIT